jgi:thioredoxin 2
VFDALIGSVTAPVLVDFWESWCGPCKMIAPDVVKTAEAGSGRWLFVKVNTETLPDLANRFRISGIPTSAMFLKGRKIARESGAMPASDMIKFIQNVALRT